MDHTQEVWQDVFPLPLPDTCEQLILQLTSALTRDDEDTMRAVFATITIQFAGRSRRIASGLCKGRSHDAEDLVAETNYKVYDLLRRLPTRADGQPRFESWQNWESFYARTMRNLWINCWHNKRNDLSLDEVERAEADEALERVSRVFEMAPDFEKHLQGLSPSELIILEATLRTSQEEAADELGCTINNVYTTMNRVRKKASAAGLSGPVVAKALDVKSILRRIHEEQDRRNCRSREVVNSSRGCEN